VRNTVPLTDCEQPSHSLCLVWGLERTGQRLVSKCQVCPRSRGTSGPISPCCWERTQLEYGQSLSVDFLPVILTSYSEGGWKPWMFIRKLPAGKKYESTRALSSGPACKILNKLSHAPTPENPYQRSLFLSERRRTSAKEILRKQPIIYASRSLMVSMFLALNLEISVPMWKRDKQGDPFLEVGKKS